MALALTKMEQDTLDKLLAKANAVNVHAPAVRAGQAYVALVNLSVPRRGPVLKPGDVPQTDLVMAGDTVFLTDEEAARFNRHDPARDGRRIEVVRRKDERSDLPAGRVHPSLLSGPIMRPPAPQPGMSPEVPRPDPAGASRIIEFNPVPESAQVTVGSENFGDALDIVPSGGMQAAVSGADREMVEAVKAQTGMSGKKG